MKAPASEQLLLLDLQAADTRLDQLAHTTKTMPQVKALAALTQELSNARALCTSIRGELDDTKIEIGRLESDAQIVQARIERDRDRLTQSSSTKDIPGLEHELASLRKRQSDLEDIELTVMERQDEIEGRYSAASARLDELVTNERELIADRDDKLAQINAEIASIDEKRVRLSSRVNAELLGLYDKQRARYGVGAALLTRGVSGGSHVALHESDLAVIRAAAPDDVLLDPDSNCILIRTDESGL
jgi:predicted  nucleic acid-binding Zn-ribbon protein